MANCVTGTPERAGRDPLPRRPSERSFGDPRDHWGHPMGRWRVHEALGSATRGYGGGEGEFGRFVHGAEGDASGGAGPGGINSARQLSASFIRLEQLRRGHAEPGLAGLDYW